MEQPQETRTRKHVDAFADTVVPEPPPDIPAPPVLSWAKDVYAEPWLKAEIAILLSHGTPFAQAAAAGLFARMWARDRGTHPLLLPRAYVAAWISHASKAQRRALEMHAVWKAWSLQERFLDRLEGDIQIPSPAAVALYADTRDNIQSVLRVLRLGGGGDELASALSKIDVIGKRFSSPRDVASTLQKGIWAHPQRRDALAWMEPHAWWSGTATHE